MSEGQGRPDRKGSRLMGYMKGGFNKWPEWLPSRIARCAVVRPATSETGTTAQVCRYWVGDQIGTNSR